MNKKTIVITGSSKGIGFGLTREFLKEGHQLIINGRNEERLQNALAELRKISRDVIAIAGDTSKIETHQKLINAAEKADGKIDIWINNAGIPQPYKRFYELKPDEIKSLLDVNIYGLMLGTKYASNYMLKQGHGKILNLEGFGSDGRMINKLTLYGSSKRAVAYFTRSFQKEIKTTSLQMGVINPGMTKTDFIKIENDYESEAERKQFEKVYKIMAEDTDKVVSRLAPLILNSNKSFSRIYYLSGFKLFLKIFKLIIS